MADSSDDDSIFRRLFKSGSIVFAGFVLEMGIAFLAKAVVARELARADYGSIALGVTVLTTVSTLTLLGLNKGVGRYIPRFERPEHRRGVFFSALEIAVPVAVLVAGGLFVFAGAVAARLFNAPGAATVLQVFAVAVPFTVVTKMTLGGVQGSQLTLPKVYIQNLAQPLSRLVLVVAFVLLGLGAVGIAWAYAVPHILASALGLYYLYRHTDLLDSSRYVPRRRELLGFSVPLVVTGIMSQVLRDIDTYLIANQIGLGPVGTYNVVYPLAELTKLVLVSFGYLVIPILSELQTDSRSDAIVRMYGVVTKWVFLSTLPLFLGMFLFPELAISLTFGAKYSDGTTALRILVLGFLFHALLGPNSNALTAFGRTQRLMYYNVVAAVLNVVVNLLLIPRYGIAGAAAATLASYVVLNLLYSYHLYLSFGVSPVSRGLVMPGLVVTVVVVGLYVAATSLLQSRLVALVAVVVPAAVLYPFVVVTFGGVGEEEIMIVENVEDRFEVDLGRLKGLFGRFM